MLKEYYKLSKVSVKVSASSSQGQYATAVDFTDIVIA